jgi:hypothetical protein
MNILVYIRPRETMSLEPMSNAAVNDIFTLNYILITGQPCFCSVLWGWIVQYD